MKTQNSIAIALGVAGVLATTAYILHINNFFSPKTKPTLEQVEVKNQAEYDFFLQTMIQEQNQPEREMLSFKGVLLYSEQAPGEHQTEWSSIESLKVNGADVDPEVLSTLLKIPTLTKKDGKAYVNYLSEEFPETFASMQNSFLYKMFPAIDLQGSSPQMQMEADEIGNVNVTYEITPSGDTFNVKRSYLQAVGDGSRYDAKKNSIQYVLASNGNLKSATGEVAAFLQAGSIITTRLNIQLKTSTLAQRKVGKLVTANMRLAPPRNPGAKLIGGTTIEGLKSLDETFTQLDTLTGDELRTEYNEMLKNVVYDLYNNPGNLAKVVAKVKSIKERDDDSKLKVTLLMASIAGTNTHEGAEALADLAKASCEDDYCREQSATASIMHQNPSVKSATTILEVAETSTVEEVSSAAYLAAGSAGGKLGNDFPQLPSALTEAITKHPEGNLRRSVILAMGNHGDASYFNPLKETLSSKNNFDRGAAVFALRNLPNPEVNGLIKQTFKSDEDRSVVLDSVRAMHARNFEATEYMEIANAGLQANQEVQEATATLLMEQAIYNQGEATEAVKTFRENTKIPDVKTLIDEGLARHEANENPTAEDAAANEEE